MYAAGAIETLDSLRAHLEPLEARRKAAERQIEASQTVSERVKRLKLMQQNPVLEVMGQTREMRTDYYRDLNLRVETNRKGVKISGIFGSHSVAPIST